jgi:spore coat polysaccharide biosynthesis predicted glycosyltransferase SpsG
LGCKPVFVRRLALFKFLNKFGFAVLLLKESDDSVEHHDVVDEIVLALQLVQLSGSEFRVVVDDQFVLCVTEHIEQALTQRLVKILDQSLVAPALDY